MSFLSGFSIEAMSISFSLIAAIALWHFCVFRRLWFLCVPNAIPLMPIHSSICFLVRLVYVLLSPASAVAFGFVGSVQCLLVLLPRLLLLLLFYPFVVVVAFGFVCSIQCLLPPSSSVVFGFVGSVQCLPLLLLFLPLLLLLLFLPFVAVVALGFVGSV